MSHHRFPVIPGSIAVLPSRRDVLRGLAVAELGLGLTGLPASLAARKKRKRKDKKPKLQRNLYGCVDVGGKCHGNDGNCCSGICQGKKPRKGQKDKSRCAAHGVEGCQPDEDQCAFVQAPCGDGGICFRTTGNANFCGDFTGLCVACRTDPDCEAETGPGSACVVCPFCAESGGTACWPPPNPA